MTVREGTVRALGLWSVAEEDLLGRGGFASVYRCHRVEDASASGAIKIFKNSHYVNTFEREVAALLSIADLPGVPQIFDYGRDAAGRLCIVTEYVAGQTLDDYVKDQGALAVPVVLDLLRGLLLLLGQVHARGLVHMDIQASNIILSAGHFHLLDWGVSESDATGVLGSIRAKQGFASHVAPECYLGRCGPASDFYSLAWLVVFLLTGSKPYHFDEEADKDYRVVAHCLERPDLPDELTSLTGNGAMLVSLVYDWLAKNPDHRNLNYNLDVILREARGSEADFYQYKALPQLQFEFSYLRVAARAGVPFAQYELALRLELEGRMRECLYWLERAHGQAYAKATRKLASLAYANSDAARGRELMRQAAENGSNAARYALARDLLASGEEDRVSEAMGWLERAAKAGNPRAQHLLATRLLAEPDKFEQGQCWMFRAAERGYEKAVVMARELSDG